MTTVLHFIGHVISAANVSFFFFFFFFYRDVVPIVQTVLVQSLIKNQQGTTKPNSILSPIHTADADASV